MKKCVFVLILLLLPLVSGISTDLQPTYDQKQTMIVEIFGNILEPIDSSQIELKRRNVQVPFDYDIQKLGDNYFIYGIAPAAENTYTLIIKDIRTTVNGVQETIDFQQNFSTTNQTTPYTLKPGFALTENQFEISLTLNQDIPQTIDVEIPEIEQVTLDPGENRFTFSTQSLPEGFSRIGIGFYSFPIYNLNDQSDPEPEPPAPGRVFAIYPETIESTILINQEINYPFRFVNLGEEPLDEVIFIYNDDLFHITPEFEGPLSPNESLEFEIELLSYEQDIDEVIIARTGEQEIEFPIFISFTENESQVETPYLDDFQDAQTGYLCNELEGTFCSADETCSGEIVSALDGNSCCLSTCVKEESETSLAWIGWLIAAIILIVIVIIAGRYLKTKKPKDKNPLSKRIQNKPKTP